MGGKKNFDYTRAKSDSGTDFHPFGEKGAYGKHTHRELKAIYKILSEYTVTMTD